MTASVPLMLSLRLSDALREFEADDSPLIAVRAGNGCGKSIAAMRKVARSALRKPGTHYRVIGPSFSQMVDTTAKYLWDLLKPYVAKGSEWREGTGWTRHGVIVLRNGSTIRLKAYTDDADTHEGKHGLEMIVLDEVPTRAVFQASLGRAKQLIILFTVQTKATPKWLRERVEGADRSPVVTPRRPWLAVQHTQTGWVQYVVAFTRENVPFYDDLEYERKAARHKGTEYEATRIWAAWETVSEERRFTGWSQRWVKTRPQLMEALTNAQGRYEFRLCRYGIDYGNGAKQYQALVFVRGDRFFLVREYVGTPTATFAEHAGALKTALEDWGLPGLHGLAKVDAIRGDINSAGPGQAGDRLNARFNRYLAIAYGLESEDHLPKLAAAPPSKHGGAKEAREIAINQLMLEGRFFVCEQCEVAIQAFSQYEGGDRDPNKDAIDAIGYSVQDLALLYERAAVPTKVRR